MLSLSELGPGSERVREVPSRRDRGAGLYFPPNGLEKRMVRRAKSDGARGYSWCRSIRMQPTKCGCGSSQRQSRQKERK